MNRKLLWKYVITGIVSVCLMVALTACSASDEKETGGQVASNQVEEPATQESVDSKEEVQQVEAEVENTEETVGENVDDTAEEMVENTTSEESQVEMVDFETWAKQEGSDEVCLVVWNEELGIQEIMPTVDESKETYQIQNGDRFAVPYRINLLNVLIDGEIGPASDGSGYIELPLEAGELVQLNIWYTTETGEDDCLSYLLK